jgi:hypothetical protein
MPRYRPGTVVLVSFPFKEIGFLPENLMRQVRETLIRTLEIG